MRTKKGLWQIHSPDMLNNHNKIGAVLLHTSTYYGWLPTFLTIYHTTKDSEMNERMRMRMRMFYYRNLQRNVAPLSNAWQQGPHSTYNFTILDNLFMYKYIKSIQLLIYNFICGTRCGKLYHTLTSGVQFNNYNN